MNLRLKSPLIYLCILIGLSLGTVESWSAENSDLVEVEPRNVIPIQKDGAKKMTAYKDRRTKWGGNFGLSYSTYEPEDFISDGSSQDFETVFQKADVPLIELSFGFKRNFSLGSAGIDFALGYYQVESIDLNIVDSTVTLMPLRMGFNFTMDNVWTEPIIAPYVSVGMYVMKYDEENNDSGATTKGTTDPALYFTGGVLFQLDWIERIEARVAYQESGIENSFLFAEARVFEKSSNDLDPNFESFHITGGLKLEF